MLILEKRVPSLTGDQAGAVAFDYGLVIGLLAFTVYTVVAAAGVDLPGLFP